MTEETQIPAEFEQLPEPARSKAFEFLQELLDAGEGKRDAVEQAIQRAQHWIAERVKPTQ
jgi:uncharacterized protein YdaT